MDSALIEKFLEENHNHTITKQEGNFSLLVYAGLLPGVYLLENYVDVDFGPLIFLTEGSKGICFFNLDKYTETTEKTFQKVLKLPAVADLPELQDFQRYQEEIRNLYKSYSAHRLASLDKEVLIGRIQEGYLLFQKLLAATVFSEALEQSLVEKLYLSVKGDVEKLEEFVRVSSLSTFQSFVTRLDEELVGYPHEKSADSLQWVFTDYYDAPLSSDLEKLINQKIEERGGVKAILDARHEALEKTEQNKKVVEAYRVSLDTDIRKLFDFIQQASYVRDIRKEAIHKISAFISNAVKALLPKMGITEDLASGFFCEDISADLLTDQEYGSVLARRKTGSLLFLERERVTFEYSNIPLLRQQLYKQMDGNSIAEIRGNTGNGGHVKGVVKVILERSDFGKFTEGDILVTSMTRPEFVPLMRKAAGVITDEGGITCHAAIICREMNKPCVIGTKMATRTLHDGDLVEVDANAGVVTILSGSLQNSLNQDLAKRLRTKKWHYIHKRQRSPLYQYLLSEGVSKHYNTLLPIEYAVGIIGLNGELAIELDSWERLRTVVNIELARDPRFLIKLLHDSYEINEKSEALTEKVRQLNYDSLSSEQMVSERREYLGICYEFGAYVILPLFVEEDMEQRLRMAIRQKFGEERSADIFHVLTTCLKKSATQLEEESLAELALHEDDERIEFHLNEYGWIKNNSFNGQCTTREELEKSLVKIRGEGATAYRESLQARQEKLQEDFTTFFSAFDDEPETQHLIETLQESIYFRSWRTERYYRTAVQREEFFKYTATLMKLETWSDLFYLTPPEILCILQGEESVPYEKIMERKAGYGLWMDPQENTIFSGDELARVAALVNVKNEKEHLDLKGRCAYPGIVSAKARVVTTKEQLAEVLEGEILVTTSTTPDYVPVLKKVKGIVTDEGGVLSHASIISRELRIPCVIGTKNATLRIKSGDLIEVNADTGMVRLLEHSPQEDYVFMWTTSPGAITYWSSPTAITTRQDIIQADLSFLGYFDGELCTAYISEQDLENIRKNISPRFLDPQDFYTYRQGYLEEKLAWWKWVRHVENKVIGSASKAELLPLYERFVRNFCDAIAHFWTSRPEWTYAVEQRLGELLRKSFHDQWSTVLGELVAATEPDDIQREQMALVKRLEGGRSDESLLEHASEFPWLIFGQFDTAYVLAFLREHADRLADKTYTELESAVEMAKMASIQRQKELLDYAEEADRKEVEYLADFLKTQAYERMEIKAYWAGCFWLCRNLLARIAELAEISLSDFLVYISPDEAIAFLNSQLSSGELKELITSRHSSYAIFREKGKELRLIAGDEATALFRTKVKRVEKGITEIKGQVASKGRYVGKVRKVITGDLEDLQDSIKDFQSGEVLVTSMTQPNMMVLAHRAGAIVTDEGGITSHAAIISRELRIPCVVGCRHAMQVLKDGDLIEVDAESGKVIIIK